MSCKFKKSVQLVFLTNFLTEKSFFIKNFEIKAFIDDCYELRSYERGVAQLGSAGALGAHIDTSYI